MMENGRTNRITISAIAGAVVLGIITGIAQRSAGYALQASGGDAWSYRAIVNSVNAIAQISTSPPFFVFACAAIGASIYFWADFIARKWRERWRRRKHLSFTLPDRELYAMTLMLFFGGGFAFSALWVASERFLSRHAATSKSSFETPAANPGAPKQSTASRKDGPPRQLSVYEAEQKIRVIDSALKILREDMQPLEDKWYLPQVGHAWNALKDPTNHSGYLVDVVAYRDSFKTSCEGLAALRNNNSEYPDIISATEQPNYQTELKSIEDFLVSAQRLLTYLKSDIGNDDFNRILEPSSSNALKAIQEFVAWRKETRLQVEKIRIQIQSNITADPPPLTAAAGIASLSDQHLRDAALDYAKKIRIFESNYKTQYDVIENSGKPILPADMGDVAKRDEWRKATVENQARQAILSAQLRNQMETTFRNEYVARGRELDIEITGRLAKKGILGPYGMDYERMVLRGSFAGPHPISDFATNVEDNARKLLQ